MSPTICYCHFQHFFADHNFTVIRDPFDNPSGNSALLSDIIPQRGQRSNEAQMSQILKDRKCCTTPNQLCVPQGSTSGPLFFLVYLIRNVIMCASPHILFRWIFGLLKWFIDTCGSLRSSFEECKTTLSSLCVYKISRSITKSVLNTNLSWPLFQDF